MNGNPVQPHKTIINIITSAAAWAWPVILSFVITPIILKYIGKDGYGVRGLIVSITGYFALLDLGLNGAGTKYLAEFNARNDKKSIKELLETTLTVYSILGFIGGLLLWVISPWLCNSFFEIPHSMLNESIWAFRLAGIGFFFNMIIWWGTSIPTGLQRFDIFNGISICYGTVNVAGNLIAVLLGFGIVGIVLSNILANIFSIILYYIYTIKLLPDIKIHFSYNHTMFKRTFSFGIYMIGFSIFSIIFAQFDKTIIGIYIGTAALTYYIIPQSIAGINQQINGKVLQLLFPKASELSAYNDYNSLRYLFFRSYNLSVIIGLAVSIPLISFSYPILNLWISSELATKSQYVLIILVSAYFFAGIVPYNIITGMGYPKYYTISSMISGISGTALFILLISPFGITGAAIAKLLSIVLTDIYYVYISKLRLKIKISDIIKLSIIPFTLAVTIIIISLSLQRSIHSFVELLFSAGLSSIVFLLFVWFLNVINRNEKEQIFNFIKFTLSKAKINY